MNENQQLTQRPKTSALTVMADKLNVDPAKLLQTLKSTVFRGATDDELLALVVIANSYGLNPILKEVYAFPAKGGGIVPVVSIDGWLRMMNDHPQFDGIDYEFEHDEQGKLISCTSIIHRKDRAHPTRVTEYLAECRRNTEPWKMERRMLRHKATIQGARVAFGFSGITDEDEAAHTPSLVRDVTPKPARAEPLNPFKEPLPPQLLIVQNEEEVIKASNSLKPAIEDPMDDAALLDLLDIINEAPDAATINKLIESAKAGFEGAKLDIAKRAINSRAKSISATWNTEGGKYE